MSSFKKLNVKVYSKPRAQTTPDNIYWKKLAPPALIKEFGAIDYVDFSPVEPYYFAVTCSVKVQIYNPITRSVHKNLSRFREAAYGGSFRSDGQLLCVGGEEKQIKLFDTTNKSLLRIFKGHESAVHRCYFTADKTHIASFSDDKTVRLWEIASEKELIKFSGHGDYVRAGAISPVSPDVILSGGYDKTVRMYDARSGVEVFSVDHGAPVESVMFLPSGGIFISAGGTEIRVWDALTGGQLRARLSDHHKTVTCMCLASDNSRLLSGSLDRHVKIYDTATFEVVHTLDYQNSILSLGVSKGDDYVVAGTVDGVLAISKRETEVKPTKRERARVSYHYAPENFRPTTVDDTITEDSQQMFSKYDRLLRKFEYSKTLDSVMTQYVLNRHPNVTIAVLQELIRRKGLEIALAGREHKFLVGLLKFMSRYFADSRYTRTLIDVVHVLIDLYEDSLDESPELSDTFSFLAKRVQEEEIITEQLLSLQGSLEMLLNASDVESSGLNDKNTNSLKPSDTALSVT